MRKDIRKYVILAAIAVMVVGAIAYSFIPTPVTVELRVVERGDLLVTVEEDGKTRIREKYIVSAPLSGRLARVQLHAGDPVKYGETILTSLDPISPSLLDARSRAEAEARLKAAEVAKQRSVTWIEIAREKAKLADEEFERSRKLFERGGLSHEERDRAEIRHTSAQKELLIAQRGEQIASYEWELAKAALMHVQRSANGNDDVEDSDWRIELRSPISGRVLRVFQEHSAVVNAGTPVLELGDPHDLEVVVDVLSRDAVKISAGNKVLLEDWGGSEPLAGHVQRVEPAGYTKVSALGIDEQRVDVVIDLDDPPVKRLTLGDDFRVEARIIIDHSEGVLTIPNGALFRSGKEMAVFVAEQGFARLRKVQVGRRGKLDQEILGGLAVNEKVITYPSDKVRDGTRITARAE